jgi:Recombinase zinc beta ribbon domain
MKSTTASKAGGGGRSLLAGLLRCARCGRMLHVVYGRGDYACYECRKANHAEAAPRCIGFSARRPDDTVGAEIFAVVQGSALSAAIEAGDLAQQQRHDQDRAWLLSWSRPTTKRDSPRGAMKPWTPTTGWWPRSSKLGGAGAAAHRRARRPTEGEGERRAAIGARRSRNSRIAGDGSTQRLGCAEQ